MLSSEINRRLFKDKTFMGCFPFDNLPAFPEHLPAKLIVNTGASSTNGEHWVALLLNPKSCFYFDSFGLPILDKEILNFLGKRYKSTTFSNMCIQNFSSDKCGNFCIYFLKMVDSKKTYQSFLKCFCDINLAFNDSLLNSI